MAGMPSERYIDCTFSPGMFGNEYAVQFYISGVTLSLFAHKDDVKVIDENLGTGLLRVRIQDESAGLISLPAETLEQGRRFLQYPINKLKTA